MTAALAACGIALTVAALTAGALRIRGRDVAATVARWRTAADRFLDRHMEPPGAHGRNAFRAELAAAKLAFGADADGPGGPLEHLPSCDGTCGGAVAHAAHLDDGWCPCCYCAQFAVTPAPGAVPGQAQAPATPRPEAARHPARQQLPQPPAVPPSASPGLGQHPFNAAVPPVYGHRDGQRVRRPTAVIRNGTVNARETGQLEALAAPVVREWATDRDTLTRALDALHALEAS